MFSRRSLVVMVIVVLLVLSAVSVARLMAPPGARVSTAAATIFDDGFDGSSLGSQWVALDRPGDASNHEVGCYRPANIAETGGNLAITTQVDPSCSGYRYTSGMAQWSTFNFTYGTVEFRAKLAGGIGTWPAVWMLGANCQQTNVTTPDNVGTCHWPSPGSEEIDIAEVYGGNKTLVNEGLITSTTRGVDCRPIVSDVSANWHTYDLVWAPGSLTWKIDGTTTCSTTSGVPTTPMFLMINTALGGVGGGPVDDSTLPQQSLVDYLRVTSDAPPAPASFFHASSPARIIDTRPVPLRTGPLGPWGPGQTQDVTVTGGLSGVPATATAVVLNVTATGGTADRDYLTIWPTGLARPTASSLNL
ncbi:MAG TPA: glycoside hydrolase family 16 protein, partial [Acidimicrobiales bacterium]